MRIVSIAVLVTGINRLLGQSAGTVVSSTTTSVTGTAGSLICTLTNTNPAVAGGVHAVCSNSGTVVLTMDAVVTPGNNGWVGSVTVQPNIITWIIQQPTGQPISWQMAANGTSKSGTF